MNKNVTPFDAIFEPALVTEMYQFGEVRQFKEGDLIMDYGKYIRYMPLILKGTAILGLLRVWLIKLKNSPSLLVHFTIIY